MPGPKTEPVTKQQFGIDTPKGRGIPNSTQPMRQTPPPIPQGRVAHAGRERLDETPAILDPQVAVRITGKLHDSADIPIEVEKTNPLEMEEEEIRAFIRKAECVERKEFGPERFANSIVLARVKRESENGARFVSIRTDDAQVWRLYPMAENMKSVEKFDKCRFTATLKANGENYLLYWETPEFKARE